jgi:hypothetical protein
MLILNYAKLSVVYAESHYEVCHYAEPHIFDIPTVVMLFSVFVHKASNGNGSTQGP